MSAVTQSAQYCHLNDTEFMPPEHSAEQHLQRLWQNLQPMGVMAISYSGVPINGHHDWLQANAEPLFKRNHLLSCDCSLIWPSQHQSLLQHYRQHLAAEDSNFVRGLKMHAPFAYQLAEGAPLSHWLQQQQVAAVINWPMPAPHGQLWSGAFTLLLKQANAAELLADSSLYQQLQHCHWALHSGHNQRFNPYLKLGAVSDNGQRVLALLAQGGNSQQIAKQIHLSARGVEYHLERLKRQLGANNRAHLVHIATRLQLI